MHEIILKFSHFLFAEFRKVESKKPNQIVFTFAGDKTYAFRPATDGPGSGAAAGATADAQTQQVSVLGVFVWVA
jgi:hypothetical protein